MIRVLTAVVSLMDESMNERVGDQKPSGRIPRNSEKLANLGHSIAEKEFFIS
jgi:hypothetical protein